MSNPMAQMNPMMGGMGGMGGMGANPMAPNADLGAECKKEAGKFDSILLFLLTRL